MSVNRPEFFISPSFLLLVHVPSVCPLRTWEQWLKGKVGDLFDTSLFCHTDSNTVKTKVMADGLNEHKILKFSGTEFAGDNNTGKGTNFYMSTMSQWSL